MKSSKKNIACFLLTLIFISYIGITSFESTASAFSYTTITDTTTQTETAPEVQNPEINIHSQTVPNVQSPEAITVAGSGDGGFYSLDFSAYNPFYYDFKLPSYYETSHEGVPSGQASNPMPRTDSSHTVESLQPQDLALGQIVPFEVKITVNGTTPPEGGVIKFTCLWDTLTSNKENFGFDPNHKVFAAFVDNGDPSNKDDGEKASATIIESETLIVGSNIKGTIKVSGLDNKDTIIVEVWVVLKSQFPSESLGKVNGTVQSILDSAKTSNGDTISTGNQTVPLNQPEDFREALGEVGINKEDEPDPLYTGDTLTYRIKVTNNSTSVVANGIVVTDTLDQNVTFVSASDGGKINGNLITWPAFALETKSMVQPSGEPPKNEKIFTVTVIINPNAPTSNYEGTNPDDRGAATVTRLDDVDVSNIVQFAMITKDSNLNNNVWQEPTNVLPRASIIAYKVWVGGPVADHMPVTLTLYRQVGSGTREEVTGVTPTITPSAGPAGKFTYTWTNLTMYDTSFQPYIYTVDEPASMVPGGYTKTGPENNTITNTYKPSLTILKVYGTAPLEGAVFELYTGDTSGPTGSAIKSITTGSDGKRVFEHLEDGTYWIVEAKPPMGYKKISDIGPFIVTNGTITGPTGYIPAADGATGNYTITVQNEPVGQLPATGGRGTILFAMVGGVLMIGAISMKRRKKLGSEL